MLSVVSSPFCAFSPAHWPWPCTLSFGAGWVVLLPRPAWGAGTSVCTARAHTHSSWQQVGISVTTRARLRSGLCHLAFVYPRASYLTSLSISLL